MAEQFFGSNAVCSADGGCFPLPPYVRGTAGQTSAPHCFLFGCHERDSRLVGYGSAYPSSLFAYAYAYQEPRRVQKEAIATAANRDRTRRVSNPARKAKTAGEAARHSPPMRRRGRDLRERAAPASRAPSSRVGA